MRHQLTRTSVDPYGLYDEPLAAWVVMVTPERWVVRFGC